MAESVATAGDGDHLGVVFVGESEGDLAGARVSGVGDMDGDGLNDILIAAPDKSVRMDLNGDGDTDIWDLNLLNSHLGDTCPGTSPGTTLTAAQFARADYDGDCTLTFTGDFLPLLSGYGSNQIGSYVGYSWDGENRLTRVEPLARDASNGAIDASLRKVEFAYDYIGRRIEKRVYKRDSSNNANWAANPIERRRFVWNGWLMLRETIDTDANADADLLDTGDSSRTKTYAWGRDLAGDLESAGGIGGLLALSDDTATSSTTSDDLNYVYFYDANGNVGQLSNLSAGNAANSLVAKYEYDAYGNVSASSGTYATQNTYRFSTKPLDDETGLGYWGYRYYESRMGRWLNRDPIGELGAKNLGAYVSNEPTRLVDAFGACVVSDSSSQVNPDLISFLKRCRTYMGTPSGVGHDPLRILCQIRACELLDTQAPPGAEAGTACVFGNPTVCFFNRWFTAPYPGIRECTDQHETVHLNECQCKGDEPLTPCTFPDSLKQSECRAYTASLICAKGKMQSDCSKLTGEKRNQCLAYYADFILRVCWKRQEMCDLPASDCDDELKLEQRYNK